VIAATGSPQFSPGKNACQASRTPDLFGDDTLLEGYRYQADFLSAGEERSLSEHIKGLPFREFEFHGLPASAVSSSLAGTMISTAAN
jgi:hypothetical protein